MSSRDALSLTRSSWQRSRMLIGQLAFVHPYWGGAQCPVQIVVVSHCHCGSAHISGMTPDEAKSCDHNDEPDLPAIPRKAPATEDHTTPPPLTRDEMLFLADLLDAVTNAGPDGLRNVADGRVRSARRSVFRALDVPSYVAFHRAGDVILSAHPRLGFARAVELHTEFDPAVEDVPTREQMFTAIICAVM